MTGRPLILFFSLNRAISGIETVCWLVIVSNKWVKAPFEAYAWRLKESVALIRRSAPSAADGH